LYNGKAQNAIKTGKMRQIEGRGQIPHAVPENPAVLRIAGYCHYQVVIENRSMLQFQGWRRMIDAHSVP
jgi:hypothetical protein